MVGLRLTGLRWWIRRKEMERVYLRLQKKGLGRKFKKIHWLT